MNMNDKDNEEFKYWLENNTTTQEEIEAYEAMSEKDRVMFCMKYTWQAACEYKQKEIDARKSELDYAARILTDVQADKLEMMGTIQKLQSENANLIEKISYLPKIPTQPYEKEMAQKIKNLENYVDKLEVALEKYAGHLGVLDEKI